MQTLNYNELIGKPIQMQLRKVKGKKDPRGWLARLHCWQVWWKEGGGKISNLILKTDLDRIPD